MIIDSIGYVVDASIKNTKKKNEFENIIRIKLYANRKTRDEIVGGGKNVNEKIRPQSTLFRF